MINKYKPHLLVIAEDDANRDIVRGFLLHHAVLPNNVHVRRPAGGWVNVFEQFKNDHADYLREYPFGHVLLVMDFDDDIDGRTQRFRDEIPEDVRSRVFLLGCRDEAENIGRVAKLNLERAGTKLADECKESDYTLWTDEQLQHNGDEVVRMSAAVGSFLFL